MYWPFGSTNGVTTLELLQEPRRSSFHALFENPGRRHAKLVGVVSSKKFDLRGRVKICR